MGSPCYRRLFWRMKTVMSFTRERSMLRANTREKGSYMRMERLRMKGIS